VTHSVLTFVNFGCK